MAHRPTIIRPSHQTPRKTPPTSKAMLSLGLIQRQGRWTDRDQRVARDASRTPVDGRVQTLGNVGGELCLESGAAGRHVEIKAARDVCRRSGDESPQKEN